MEEQEEKLVWVVEFKLMVKVRLNVTFQFKFKSVWLEALLLFIS